MFCTFLPETGCTRVWYIQSTIIRPWVRIHNLAVKRGWAYNMYFNVQWYIAYVQPDVKPPLLYSNSQTLSSSYIATQTATFNRTKPANVVF